MMRGNSPAQNSNSRKGRAWARLLVGMIAAPAIMLPAAPASAASEQCSTSPSNDSCSTAPVSANGPLRLTVHANTSSCTYKLVDVDTTASVWLGSAGQGSQHEFTLSGMYGPYSLSITGTGCWGELDNLSTIR